MSETTFHIDKLNWSEDVYRRLGAAVRRAQAVEERPVAVFDFDNTCILGDIGELFSHYLIDEIGYRYDLDAFWDLVHPSDGRDHIRALVDEMATMSPTACRQSACYGEYLAEMGAIYGRKYVREGAAPCYEWAVCLHVGMTPAELHAQTLRALSRELAADIEREVRHTRRGEAVRIDHGIRVHRELREIIAALDTAGFDVWVVSATNQWTVEICAEHLFGVDRDRVLGNRLDIGADGRLGSAIRQPVLYRAGKVDIIEQAIGRQPSLVFGDSQTDFEMMCYARELAVLIDRGEASLRGEAERLGWAIQPQDELTRSGRPHK